MKLKYHWQFRLAMFKLRLLGYIEKDGAPKKCPHCKSKDLETYERFYTDYYLDEYWVRCKKCKERVGIWSYGSWIY